MANNLKEFERARMESEPLFCQVLDSYNPDFPYKMLWRQQVNGVFDTLGHTDIVGDADCPDGKIRLLRFDVKDVEDGNFGTGNYSLGEGCIKFFKDYDGLAFFAFRLNDKKSTRLNQFLVVQAQDVVNSCTDIFDSCCLKDKENGNSLVSLIEIKEKCPYWWILEKDF